MAKFCPVTKEQVLYLECLECEDKQVCKELSNAAYSDINPDKSIIIIKNED